MLEIKGKYGVATVYTDKVEEGVKTQLEHLCNQEFTKGKSIKIMSDVHAGKGCVIGFTAELGELVIPNIVGVDIGCGVLALNLGKVDINLEELDTIIKESIPSGFNRRSGAIKEFTELEDLHLWELGTYDKNEKLSFITRFNQSIGTLGGGNHFIELAKDEDGNKYLIIHTGSRNLGKNVAEFYQKLAIEQCKGMDLDKDLCYLTGDLRLSYLHDMEITQRFATLNRETIATLLLDRLGLEAVDKIESVHNYIDLDNNIIRKGAVASNKDEKLIIPINMRDGSLICRGKGNKEWNYSAPHGAGRVLSRGEAKRTISLDKFKETMEGIYTTCVNKSTIDESPFAYKNIEDITKHIGDTVDIITVIKPIYNFKASE